MVEEDEAILAGLVEKLQLEGYHVTSATDGEAARDLLADELPELVVLDSMLPKLDGLSVLRRLRRREASLPVLIPSAKGREEEKIEGLRAGADDYLAKPFGLGKLLARIEGLLRRARRPTEGLSFGDVEIDFVGRRVLRAGREVVLSCKELDLLFFLARRRDRSVTREEILDAVWGHLAASTARAVDFHIVNLRRKLEVDPKTPRYIVTRHDLGSQLAL